MIRFLFTASLCLLCSLSAATEIYRSTDQYGNTVFSDKAPKHSTPVALPSINTTPATEVSNTQSSSSSTSTVTMSNKISIQSPANGAILPNGRLPTAVRVTTQNAVDPSLHIEFELDGQVLNSSSSTQHTIPRLSRGPHRIQASLKNQAGKVISKDAIDIMVYQPGN